MAASSVLLFLVSVLFVLSFVQNQRLERDSVTSGVLTLPKDWRGGTTFACSFGSLPRSPTKSFIVRNYFYSIIEPSGGAELHVRPVDAVYQQGCRYQSNSKFLSFSATQYAISVSPEEDQTILSTIVNGQWSSATAKLTLTMIDARDLFISQKSISFSWPSSTTAGHWENIRTSFLNNRFMLIEIFSDYPVKLKMHFLFDKLKKEVEKIATLPVSIANDKFVIYTQSEGKQLFVWTQSYQSGESEVVAFSFYPSHPLNFTKEWKYDFVSSAQSHQLLYHSGLNKVIVSASSLYVLDADTGKLNHRDDYVYATQIVGGVGDSFYLKTRTTVEQVTFSPTTLSFTKRMVTSFASFSSMRVGQSGELYLVSSGTSSTYSSQQTLTIIQNGLPVILDIAAYGGVLFFTPTNHYLLIALSDGRYLLYTPSFRPTPSPTPYSRYSPTPYYPPSYYTSSSSSWWDPLWVKLLIIAASAAFASFLVFIVLRFLKRARRSIDEEAAEEAAAEAHYPAQLLRAQNMAVDSNASNYPNQPPSPPPSALPSPPEYSTINPTVTSSGSAGYQFLPSHPLEEEEEVKTADAVDDHDNNQN